LLLFVVVGDALPDLLEEEDEDEQSTEEEVLLLLAVLGVALLLFVLVEAFDPVPINQEKQYVGEKGTT